MSDSVRPSSQSTDTHSVDTKVPDSLGLSTLSARASSDAFLSSGQSPGCRVHLVGPGKVGQSLLRQLLSAIDRGEVVVTALTDRSATVFARDGLSVADLLAFKQAGGVLADCQGAERIPAELAIRLVAADVVVDATPSTPGDTELAVQRGRAALQTGASLALCGKNALARVASEWLAPATRSRLGIDAVLGGTGAQLQGELDELRTQCTDVALVGNVTTTAIIDAIERGASLEQGIGQAHERGFLEPDATLDLDGSDAATKLLCVHGAVFGDAAIATPSLAAVAREAIESLDPVVLRERRARGATTRLIARSTRDLRELRVAFEELPVGSPLAAPPDRVVYGYQLPRGLRVHTGLGVGHDRTAAALRGDVTRLLQEVAR